MNHAMRPLLIALGLATLPLAPMPPLQAEPMNAETLKAEAAKPSPSPAVANPDRWKDEVIYLIMVDRFFNGNPKNDRKSDPRAPFAYHGGDLEGIIQKLDTLKDLGVTMLWLTPVSDNQDNALEGKYWGYHGYWIQRFDKVEEHFGSELDFKRLVDAAHARGLKVILDAVVNHPGYDAPMAQEYSYRDWFHKNGDITDWEDPYQNENFKLAGLPDFNSENLEVLKFMEDAWSSWVKRYGIDGFRMDTVRHVPLPFWSRFNQTLRERAGKPLFIVGEVSYHQPRKLVPYLEDGHFDSLFDFPMFGTMREVFARGGSMKLLADRLRQDAVYPDAGRLSPFLDNHDEARFMTEAKGDARRLTLALTCLFTMRGIPSLYYGTEVGMQGGRDPDNRRDMTWGANPGLFQTTRSLIALRKELAPLRHGRMVERLADDQVYAFSRILGDQEVVVVLNNHERPQRRTVTLTGTTAPEGSDWVNRLGADRHRSQGQSLSLELAPFEAKVLVRAPR